MKRRKFIKTAALAGAAVAIPATAVAKAKNEPKISIALMQQITDARTLVSYPPGYHRHKWDDLTANCLNCGISAEVAASKILPLRCDCSIDTAYDNWDSLRPYRGGKAQYVLNESMNRAMNGENPVIATAKGFVELKLIT